MWVADARADLQLDPDVGLVDELFDGRETHVRADVVKGVVRLQRGKVKTELFPARRVRIARPVVRDPHGHERRVDGLDFAVHGRDQGVVARADFLVKPVEPGEAGPLEPARAEFRIGEIEPPRNGGEAVGWPGKVQARPSRRDAAKILLPRVRVRDGEDDGRPEPAAGVGGAGRLVKGQPRRHAAGGGVQARRAHIEHEVEKLLPVRPVHRRAALPGPEHFPVVPRVAREEEAVEQGVHRDACA